MKIPIASSNILVWYKVKKIWAAKNYFPAQIIVYETIQQTIVYDRSLIRLKKFKVIIFVHFLIRKSNPLKKNNNIVDNLFLSFRCGATIIYIQVNVRITFVIIMMIRPLYFLALVRSVSIRVTFSKYGICG